MPKQGKTLFLYPNDSSLLVEPIGHAKTGVDDDRELPITNVAVKDPTVNPIPYLGLNNPFPTLQAPNLKSDFVSGTAAGTTATTATFNRVNTLEVVVCLPVTSGATTITLTGTTSGKVIYKWIMPTTTVIENIQGLRVQPCVNISNETVTLTIGADWTSGTISVNVYGN